MLEDDALGNVDKGIDDDAVANPAEAKPVEGDDQVNDIEVVCRPRVGYRVAGGGFLGIWKKMKH